MSHERDELERRLANLPTPIAREEFRRDLRARFARGSVRAETAPAKSPKRVGWWLAAAAALVVSLGAAIIAATRDNPSRWTVIDGGSSSAVLVDGRSIDAHAIASLARALDGARTIVTTEASLRCELTSVGSLELAERSELALVSIPGANAPDEILLELRSGALRVITYGELAPARMRVRAPDGEVLVVGTEFAIDVVPGGTCICCTHGIIEVTSVRHRDDRQRVTAGGMAWCSADGAATMTGAVKPDHVQPLDELRAVSAR